MGRKIVFLVAALSLSACVNSMYHPMAGATPAMSAYAANKACLPEVENAAFQQPVAPGLIPEVALMASPAGQQHQAVVNDVQNACMAHYGWARN